MADRTCELCKKIFDMPHVLKRHQSNKRTCAPIIAPPDPRYTTSLHGSICRFCNRVFASVGSMRYHIRKSCKIAPNAKNGNAGMEILYEHTLQQRVMALEVQNAEMLTLMRQMAVHGAAPATSTSIALTNNTGPVSNNTIGALAITTMTLAAGEVGVQLCDRTDVDVDKSITFNLFGKETLAHATNARVKDILDESLRLSPNIQAAALMAVTKTAMLIYSDPDHPENLTCYMPNKKTTDVLAHTERGWEIFPVSMVINQIGQKTIDHLFDKQPHEDAETYTQIMKELQQNEQAYITDAIIRPVLVRNRSLLEIVLDVLPKSGAP